jgi:hypothetical protein
MALYYYNLLWTEFLVSLLFYGLPKLSILLLLFTTEVENIQYLWHNETRVMPLNLIMAVSASLLWIYLMFFSRQRKFRVCFHLFFFLFFGLKVYEEIGVREWIFVPSPYSCTICNDWYMILNWRIADLIFAEKSSLCLFTTLL